MYIDILNKYLWRMITNSDYDLPEVMVFFLFLTHLHVKYFIMKLRYKEGEFHL